MTVQIRRSHSVGGAALRMGVWLCLRGVGSRTAYFGFDENRIDECEGASMGILEA